MNAVRNEYLVDGFRVSFLHQADWRCACSEFVTNGACRHTREAAGMQEAQVQIRRRSGTRLGSISPRDRRNR